MANAKSSGEHWEYATVDTAPAQGSGGYYTNEVAPRSKKLSNGFYFSIRESVDDSSPSTVVVKLQFKCPRDAGWSDYLKNGTDNWPIGTRVKINDNAAGVLWRAGVVDNSDFTSGSVTFGFDW